MIAFSKFVELHEEKSSCISEIEKHLESYWGMTLETTKVFLQILGYIT